MSKRLGDGPVDIRESVTDCHYGSDFCLLSLLSFASWPNLQGNH